MTGENWFAERKLANLGPCLLYFIELVSAEGTRRAFGFEFPGYEDFCAQVDALMQGDGDYPCDYPFRGFAKVRSKAVDQYAKEEPHRQDRSTAIATGLVPYDPKSKWGMLNVLILLVSSKWNIDEVLNGIIAGQPTLGFGNTLYTAGAIGGDELTIHRVEDCEKALLMHGCYHDDINVRMWSFVMCRALEQMAKEMGDFHVGMQGTVAEFVVHDTMTIRPVLQVTHSGDLNTRHTVTKKYQRSELLMTWIFFGRVLAGFCKLIENGDMPKLNELFADGVLQPPVFADMVDTMLSGGSDMEHFFGTQLVDLHVTVEELKECVRWHDAEGLAYLPRRLLPYFAVLGKRNYNVVCLREIEGQTYGSLAANRARFTTRTYNDESLGSANHAIAGDCWLEVTMPQLKPAARNSGLGLAMDVSRVVGFPRALRRGYDESIGSGRYRSVRAKKKSLRAAKIGRIVRLFLESGFASYEVGGVRGGGLENVTLSHVSHDTGAIGEASKFAGCRITLSDTELAASGNSSVAPGVFRVYRAEALPGGAARILLRREA
jgi:hypothetical protein